MGEEKITIEALRKEYKEMLEREKSLLLFLDKEFALLKSRIEALEKTEDARR